MRHSHLYLRPLRWSLISGQNSLKTFQPTVADRAVVPLNRALVVLALLVGYHALEMNAAP